MTPTPTPRRTTPPVATLLATTAALLAGLFAAGCLTTAKVEGPPDPRPPPPPPPLPVVQVAGTSDPILTIRAVFTVGSADDPVGREGLTALTGRLMREATESLDANALGEALYPLAGELSVFTDKDTTVFAARVHRDHAAAFLPIFVDVLLRPRLDPTDFARLRQEQRDHVVNTLRQGNDELLQREALEAAIYDARVWASASSAPRTHPYAHTPAGTVAGIDALTLDDVRAHRLAKFNRDRLVLGLAGAAATPAIERQLRQELGALPGDGFARGDVAAPAVPAHNRLLIIDKPAPGTAISLGFALPELGRAHPDYAAMKLAETWFGEHRNLIGHLFNSMREARGLNYGDYAYIEHFVQEGWSTLEKLNVPRRSQYFSMWIRPVEHKNRLFALHMTAWELARFVERGIPEDETFARIQAFVQGYWVSKEQEPTRRLGYAIDAQLTGQPYDRDGLRAAVAGLTRAQVNAAIRRHLHKDGLTLVVVTQDGAALREELLAKKPPSITYAAKVAERILAEDAEIAAFDLKLAPEHIVVVPPAALFAR